MNQKPEPIEMLINTQKQVLEMNDVLYECYSKNQVISLIYYGKEKIQKHSGVIEQIDVLNNELILLPNKKFSFQNILSVSIK